LLRHQFFLLFDNVGAIVEKQKQGTKKLTIYRVALNTFILPIPSIPEYAAQYKGCILYPKIVKLSVINLELSHG
jgi:hypothetical protein